MNEVEQLREMIAQELNQEPPLNRKLKSPAAQNCRRRRMVD
jgi:hypothetical protein